MYIECVLLYLKPPVHAPKRTRPCIYVIIDRLTDRHRQRDRQTDTDRDRQTDRHTHVHRERGIHTHTHEK